MDEQALFWLFITLLCILTQGFFSMLEMAAISFNKVRLEYYVNKGVKWAIWLQYLLQKPSRLFGTVMIGVNVALQVGSQSARELYRALHLNPDIAAITQVFFVVIVAELAPLFAAHRYAEHVVKLGIPIVYATQYLLAPIVWIIGFMSKGLSRLFGKKSRPEDPFLTREELQKIIEAQEEGEGEEFSRVVSNIFTLKTKKADACLQSLEKVVMLPANASVSHLRETLAHTTQAFIPLFHKHRSNVVAIAIPKDLVGLSDNKTVRDFSSPPWFITIQTPLLQILEQFQKNRQAVSVILDSQGSAVGILTLDAIIRELFGETIPDAEAGEEPLIPVIERSYPGNTKVSDLILEFGLHIDARGAETLAQLMITELERPPEEGESVFVGPFELIAEETTLLGTKTVLVKTRKS